jgi:PAS domain S-box-containing protein
VTQAHDLEGESLGAVLKTALDAVVVMRMDGTIAGWNHVAERSFGWSFAEANGRRMSDMIIPERFRSAHERGLAHLHATGDAPVLNRHIEIHALHRDGHELPVELSITQTSQFGVPVFLGFLRDISERHAATRRQELLISELNHRVKNVLGVVAGIAHMTARSSASLDAFEPAFAGRLMALSKAHEILTAATWERASLHRLAEDLLGPVASGDGARVTIAGPDLLLPPRQLLSVGMILHELLTNAVKYGALAVPAGHIALEWAIDGTCLEISWTETGLSGVSAPDRAGFGSRMIAMSVSHELRGQSTTEWRDDGLAFTFRFDTE